ncbi:hypothetical protein A3C09_04370 [Candidatus Uhrbacteria bacterium RIFCSPHIGHO2_02_FULL_47_44]|nr:MAG: hypothetical protein A3C09_04370 [Candidatus Uhrbacteria bacterium RIFCSPHIGHO2_02_FULL_47_44]
MLFFFLIFDGMMMFHVPLIITGAGLSEAQMGLIIGSSSIAGIIFDFLLTHILKKATYRRMFLVMLLMAATFPLILWKGQSMPLLFLGMIVWGIYYDLYNCGTLDFIGRTQPKEEHASSAGVVDVFIAFGYLIAPILASTFMKDSLDASLFYFAWGFLGIAFIFYLVLRRISPEKHTPKTKKHLVTFFSEMHLHKDMVSILFPVFLVSTMLMMIESTYWMIAPLIELPTSWPFEFNGLFLFAHELPLLIVGWIIGEIIGKRSKKRVAFVTLLVGSTLMMLFLVVRNPFALIFLSFLCAVCTGITWPAIRGAYADYVSDVPNKEQDIELLQDSFTNLGFIVGPVLAGSLSGAFGHLQTIGIIGVVTCVISLILLVTTPKNIDLAARLNALGK